MAGDSGMQCRRERAEDSLGSLLHAHGGTHLLLNGGENTLPIGVIDLLPQAIRPVVAPALDPRNVPGVRLLACNERRLRERRLRQQKEASRGGEGAKVAAREGLVETAAH
eukprot:scaffold317330_cov32-Tisochrysis_lutea.AAC.3